MDPSTIGLERAVVRLEAHNPEWARLYERERARLSAALGTHVLDLQHVGSTAIPGIVAKPILDIAAAVRSFEAAFVCIEPIVALGYAYYGENGIPRRHYFVRRDPVSGQAIIHLHMNELGGPDWENQILFRDYLIAHPEAAAQYSALKRDLAAQYPHDREAYTEAKAPFIEHVLRLARAE